MSISNKLLNEILIHGKYDWVMASEVVSIIITIEGISHKEDKLIKDISLELIRKVVLEGLMVIGDVPKGGFKKWDLPVEEAITKVEKKWESLGRNPRLGEICWLSNTEKGDEIASGLLKK